MVQKKRKQPRYKKPQPTSAISQPCQYGLKALILTKKWKIAHRQPISRKLRKIPFDHQPWYKRLMKKPIDLTKIDFRVGDSFLAKKTKSGYKFSIREIFIEDIHRQHKELISVNRVVHCGDWISIDMYFGYHDGEWISVPFKGNVKVVAIDPIDDIGEIRIKIKPIKIEWNI